MNFSIGASRSRFRPAILLLYCVGFWCVLPHFALAGDMFPIPSDSLFKLLFNYECKDQAEAEEKMQAILFNHLWNFYRSETGFVDLVDMVVHVNASDDLHDVDFWGFKAEDSVRVWLRQHGLTVFERTPDSKEHIDEYLRRVRQNVDRGLDSAAELWLELQRHRPSAGLTIWVNNRPMDPLDDWDTLEWKSSLTLQFNQRMFLERDFLWGPTACDADTWGQTLFVTSTRQEHHDLLYQKLHELVDLFAAALAKKSEQSGEE